MPSRPILLNLGQGVAWGRLVRPRPANQHPEDYPEYVKGGDIVSFDIYPVNHEERAVRGNLWYVARGVERLVQWSKGENRSGTASNAPSSPTRNTNPAQQVRAEVWMSLIHGARGLIYFVHQFKPTFDGAACCKTRRCSPPSTRINRQITGLAPVLNRPASATAVTCKRPNPDVLVAAMVKQLDGATWLFCRVHARSAPKRHSPPHGGRRTRRTCWRKWALTVTNRSFRDHFAPWPSISTTVPNPNRPAKPDGTKPPGLGPDSR